jgi:hypothetical protein
VGSKLPREEEEEESWIQGLGFDGTPTQIVWRRDRAIMALRSSDAASEPDNVTFLHTPTHTHTLSLSLSLSGFLATCFAPIFALTSTLVQE